MNTSRLVPFPTGARKPARWLILASVLACGWLAAADLTITFSTTGKGGGGTEIHYYSPAFHMVRNEKEQRDTLVDFVQGVSYTIDHKKKAITKVTFDDALAALDALGQAQTPGVGAVMGAMFGDPNDCKVDQGETEVVAGRTCQDWNIKVGKLTMALAADPSLRMPVPDADAARMMRTRAAQFAKAGPMGASFKRLYEEMARIKGIPLKTHLKGMMGMDTGTEATRIDTLPIPLATFALPEGYKVEDAGRQMRDGTKGK